MPNKFAKNQPIQPHTEGDEFPLAALEMSSL